jgi:hypothetical protein
MTETEMNMLRGTKSIYLKRNSRARENELAMTGGTVVTSTDWMYSPFGDYNDGTMPCKTWCKERQPNPNGGKNGGMMCVGASLRNTGKSTGCWQVNRRGNTKMGLICKCQLPPPNTNAALTVEAKERNDQIKFDTIPNRSKQAFTLQSANVWRLFSGIMSPSQKNRTHFGTIPIVNTSGFRFEFDLTPYKTNSFYSQIFMSSIGKDIHKWDDVFLGLFFINSDNISNLLIVGFGWHTIYKVPLQEGVKTHVMIECNGQSNNSITFGSHRMELPPSSHPINIKNVAFYIRFDRKV